MVSYRLPLSNLLYLRSSEKEEPGGVVTHGAW
jgi:hypothetical protein